MKIDYFENPSNRNLDDLKKWVTDTFTYILCTDEFDLVDAHVKEDHVMFPLLLDHLSFDTMGTLVNTISREFQTMASPYKVEFEVKYFDTAIIKIYNELLDEEGAGDNTTFFGRETIDDQRNNENLTDLDKELLKLNDVDDTEFGMVQYPLYYPYTQREIESILRHMQKAKLITGFKLELALTHTINNSEIVYRCFTDDPLTDILLFSSLIASSKQVEEYAQSSVYLIVAHRCLGPTGQRCEYYTMLSRHYRVLMLPHYVLHDLKVFKFLRKEKKDWFLSISNAVGISSDDVFNYDIYRFSVIKDQMIRQVNSQRTALSTSEIHKRMNEAKANFMSKLEATQNDRTEHLNLINKIKLLGVEKIVLKYFDVNYLRVKGESALFHPFDIPLENGDIPEDIFNIVKDAETVKLEQSNMNFEWLFERVEWMVIRTQKQNYFVDYQAKKVLSVPERVKEFISLLGIEPLEIFSGVSRLYYQSLLCDLGGKIRFNTDELMYPKDKYLVLPKRGFDDIPEGYSEDQMLYEIYDLDGNLIVPLCSEYILFDSCVAYKTVEGLFLSGDTPTKVSQVFNLFVLGGKTPKVFLGNFEFKVTDLSVKLIVNLMKDIDKVEKL